MKENKNQVMIMSKPNKWIKWGIGAGGTLVIALLFQGIRQNDAFLEAVAANQDSQEKRTAQITDSDSLNPYRLNDDHSQSGMHPETDTSQPFLFVLPQDRAASLVTDPQARTHASFAVPGRAESGNDMSEQGDRDDHDRDNHHGKGHDWKGRGWDGWPAEEHDEHHDEHEDEKHDEVDDDEIHG
ncbi:MAG: hypothetical protein BAA01_01960 [Bacillus thermozeamaize]|jgi:hypothetical protein|uniref:Uncharacterized protein n=1 Tax=Bacillus thermozeamaize TaxID=230954 RepID=A0A1Y3PLX1_9BACI|nr:MAG: hypothetical protein BAA01_01960 [Bacillus thermozeamaize]